MAEVDAGTRLPPMVAYRWSAAGCAEAGVPSAQHCQYAGPCATHFGRARKALRAYVQVPLYSTVIVPAIAGLSLSFTVTTMVIL
jgi:hypothetical protein